MSDRREDEPLPESGDGAPATAPPARTGWQARRSSAGHMYSM